MESRRMLTILVLALGLTVGAAAVSKGEMMGTAFTYRGQLIDADEPAEGFYNFQFKLFDDPFTGSQIAGDVNKPDVDVIDGYFTVELDFVGRLDPFEGDPDVLGGERRWLEIGVRPGELNDPNAYTILAPRQEITPTPYALFATRSYGNFGSSIDVILGGINTGSGEGVVGASKTGIGVRGMQTSSGNYGDLGTSNCGVYGESASDYAGYFQGKGYFSDNVGIGTTSPGQKLDVDLGNLVVQGTGSFDSPGDEGIVYLGSIHHYIKGVHGFGVKIGAYAVGDALSIREVSGYVGIGTTNPSYRLDVAGPINLNKGSTGAALHVDGMEALWSDGTYFSWGYGGTANYFADNVGIGTTNPVERLHVSGRARFDLGTGQINMSTPGGWPGIIAYSPNGHRRDIAYDDSGMSISVSSTASAPAIVNGVRIFEDGKVAVKVLQITGGSDMAEPFDVKETDVIKAGMVLSIDPDNAGKLKISGKAYDRCVAGIVSGAGGVKPGMLMGQKGTEADGEHPVALTGRVYCWADASNGPIEPGDLLTTSDTPGHAMKVKDYKRAQGAILGKAMSSLESGRGLVLVLVTLQ